MELVRKPLRRPQGHQLQPATIVLRPERGRRLSADVTGSCIGYESFRAATRRDEAMTSAVLARFLRHQQDHRAGVPRRIARIPEFAHLPLATDLQCNFLDVACTDVGKRDDRHLARRLRPHIFGDALHPLHRVGLENVGEIIYQSRWWRDLDTLWEKEERCRPQHGKQLCRRWKTQQQYVQDLLSLDFMVREEVYLADDSLPRQSPRHVRHCRTFSRLRSDQQQGGSRDQCNYAQRHRSCFIRGCGKGLGWRQS
jgi:hypothetical protein